MKITFPAILLAFSSSISLVAGSPEPQSRYPVVSLLITQSAFSGPLKDKEGWIFYSVKQSPFPERLLLSNSFHHGQVEEDFVTGSSSGSSRVLKEIESVGLEPFDWLHELTVARDRYGEAHKYDDSIFAEPSSLDGAEWEIVVTTAKGEFRMKAWNPGPLIDFYAPCDDRIGRLKRVIDILALSRGRKELGI